ncbi:MAG: cupin domain-containing protein [Candidatus Zixiibacteriota bacterium]
MLVRKLEFAKRQLIVYLSLLVLTAGCALEKNTANAQISQDKDKQGSKTIILKPDEGDVVWFFAKSKDELGAGGELQIYLDHHTHPEAKAAFAKFTLGLGGALPTHKHEKTEEIAYFLSGEGVALFYENGEIQEVSVRAGYVWYNPVGGWHSVRNTGSEPLVMVFATIPNEEKGLLSFFRRIGVKPGEEATALSPEEFGRVAAEHELRLKPPNSSK